jgi:Uncharacterized protein conserved in bacteria (DUF2147)
LTVTTVGPEGIWQIDDVALDVSTDDDGVLYGRIVWLRHWRDEVGELAHDRLNPDPDLRQRPLCGLTVLWGLRPAGPNRWTGGSLYNPDDGHVYGVNAHLVSTDEFRAHIYRGIPLFGRTRTLVRIGRGSGEGWC